MPAQRHRCFERASFLHGADVSSEPMLKADEKTSEDNSTESNHQPLHSPIHVFGLLVGKCNHRTSEGKRSTNAQTTKRHEAHDGCTEKHQWKIDQHQQQSPPRTIVLLLLGAFLNNSFRMNTPQPLPGPNDDVGETG